MFKKVIFIFSLLVTANCFSQTIRTPGSTTINSGTVVITNSGFYNTDQFTILSTTNVNLKSGANVTNINNVGGIGINGITRLEFPLVTDMVAFNVGGTAGTATCTVKGRRVDSDGFGGIFTYVNSSSLPTNSGTVFPVTGGSGRWIRMFSGPLNLGWFGAVPDGSTDNYTAMQEWLNLASGHTNGYYAFIPSAGVFNFGQTLTVTNAGGITIKGEGEIGALTTDASLFSGSHIRYTGTNAGGYGMVFGPTNATINGVYLQNFRFAGVYANTIKPNGILIQNCSGSEFNNLQINGGFDNGLSIIQSTLLKAKRLNIQACTNAIALLPGSHLGSEFAETGALDFDDLNVYLITKDAFHVQGSANNIRLKNAWIEWCQNAIHFDPSGPDLFSCYDWYIDKSGFSVGDIATWPNSRIFKADLNATNFFVNNLFFTDTRSYTGGTDYSFEVHVGVSPPLRFFRNLMIRDWTTTGANQGLLTNDYANAQFVFRGIISCTDTNSADVPLFKSTFGDTTGRREVDLMKYGYKDFSDSGPWLLPTNAAPIAADDQFYFNPIQHRPSWRKAGTFELVASLSDIYGSVTGVGNWVPRWSNSTTLTLSSIYNAGNQVGIGTTNLAAGVLTIGGGDVFIQSTTGSVTRLRFKNKDTGVIVGGISEDNNLLSIWGGSPATHFAIDTNGMFWLSSSGLKIMHGTGSPEGVKQANIGSLYLQEDGGAGTILWIKESGVFTTTGWFPYSALGGSNIGTGVGVYAGRSGTNNQFNTLLGSGGLTISSNTGTITIASTAITNGSSVGTGWPIFSSKSGQILQFNNITNDATTTISLSGQNLIIGLPSSGVTAASYVAPYVTFDAQGRATAAAASTNVTTIAVTDPVSVITTGANKQYWRAPYTLTLKDCRASVSTASSSGLVTVNVKKNGTTIFATKVTIDASEETSVTAATGYSFSTTAVADDDKITFDIDGAGTGAVGLQVKLYYTRP